MMRDDKENKAKHEKDKLGNIKTRISSTAADKTLWLTRLPHLDLGLVKKVAYQVILKSNRGGEVGTSMVEAIKKPAIING